MLNNVAFSPAGPNPLNRTMTPIVHPLQKTVYIDPCRIARINLQVNLTKYVNLSRYNLAGNAMYQCFIPQMKPNIIRQ